MIRENLHDNAGSASGPHASPLISVIVCSINLQLCARLQKNIAETIGVPHEFRVVRNEVERLGICSAYNKAAVGAIGRVLCFIHEDVEMLTPYWGRRVLAHLEQDPHLGLIGVAGARYKSRIPTGWFSGDPQFDCANVHHGSSRDSAQHVLMRPPAFAYQSRVPVAVLDGVWLCMPRTVWLEHQFDEQLPGFHFYDIDISLRCTRSHQVAVIYDIDLLHFSLGNFDDDWLKAALKFHESAGDQLPALCEVNREAELLRLMERRVTLFWVKFLRSKLRSLRLRWEFLKALPPIASISDAWHRLRLIVS